MKRNYKKFAGGYKFLYVDFDSYLLIFTFRGLSFCYIKFLIHRGKRNGSFKIGSAEKKCLCQFSQKQICENIYNYLHS